MIVGEQKPLEEIKGLVAEAEKVLVVGCGTCVTVSFAGGTKEVGILASSLRMATKLDGNAKQFDEATVQRQCEWEYIDPLEAQLSEYDLVLSLGCGIGVQAVAERFTDIPVLPGVNTSFLGVAKEWGIWDERCAACGDCRLGETAGICPVTRCTKGILNGPCGGMLNGKCEVGGYVRDCAWYLIWEKLRKFGRMDIFRKVRPPRQFGLEAYPRGIDAIPSHRLDRESPVMGPEETEECIIKAVVEAAH